MTTTLAAPATVTAVFSVDGMPAGARWDVEKLLCSLPAAPVVEPLIDEWDTAWCTRWRRTPEGYSCSEVLHAPQAELREFERALNVLAGEHGFVASVEMRPYDGEHV
ncbi:hypothetical protein [Corynebacterium auris]|uniref:hypothetical protein n=1 Tax=Corynebacterium auris TaxID=44750 RepID=UPI0025B59B9C|nr:hypothetical protein [Corynebacterium auris]WJY68493.1 hypothetical protein CAURIS_08000 [Corynebacterium auris]